jgi:long-subunit acyl-CoA synthetase (AMP-forming)
MRDEAVLRSDLRLPEYPQNLARMLNENARRLGGHAAIRQRMGGEYRSLSWQQLQRDVRSIQECLLERGMEKGDRVAIVSRNRQEMLEMELAIMCLGGAAVPIFPAYTPAQTQNLVRFCRPKMIVAAEELHLGKLGDVSSFSNVFYFDSLKLKAPNLVQFKALLGHAFEDEILGEDLPAETTCLMMYTSGTMGKPKCVQLAHRNILSQQAAGTTLWPLSKDDRFLSYLPWHHSYGGIFEKYSALVNGATIALESGYGKDLDVLVANWKEVQPTVFFSVPLIYQALVARARQSKEVAEALFHPRLRFVFTAAAPLPKTLSDEFESRGVTILEGWGLTETSPCCTVTRPGVARQPGVVGWPIPGVELKLTEENEILVRGPNVMKGYFDNPEETERVFRDDGWFHTGDVGELTPNGLRLVSRKDRIFKLSNAEKVVPAEIENMITHECPYLAWAFVTGSGKEHPVALVFPNRAMFAAFPEDTKLPLHCCCPRDAGELSQCLGNCLHKVNRGLDEEYCRMSSVMLVDHELTIDREELTPSMKLAPNVVGQVFKGHIEHLYAPNDVKSDVFTEPVYIIKLK